MITKEEETVGGMIGETIVEGVTGGDQTPIDSKVAVTKDRKVLG